MFVSFVCLHLGMKTLGATIRELRDSRDLSLREFAKKLSVSPAHVSDIEKDRRNPSDALLKEIARLLGVHFEDLQKLDRRAPVEDLKRIASQNPTFGFALRKLAEKDVTAEEILALAKK